MELTDVHLRYLMAISDIGKTTPKISSQQVAQTLGVSKPSVNYILDVLMKRRLIVKERYGKIYLTDRGAFAVRFYGELRDRVLEHFPMPELELTPEERRSAALAMAAALPSRLFSDAYQRLYGEFDQEEFESGRQDAEGTAN